MNSQFNLCIQLFFLSLGCIFSPISAQPIPVTPQIIEVEGTKMRIMTAGFEHLRQGVPVVVFESGAGTSINNWGKVFTEVSEFAPVIAYDRGGIGESEWDGQAPTPERVTTKLQALLYELEAPPPYILVGHSWGGHLIRHFAGRFPDRVAGLVYVDPTDFTQSRAEELAALTEIGVADGEAALEAMDQAYTYYTSKAPSAIEAEYSVIDSLAKLNPEDRGLLPSPSVPIAVLIGSRYRVPPPRPPGVEFGFEFRDYFDATVRQRVRKMSEWVLAAPEGFFVLATHASHYVHQDDPALLVDAIRRVVFPDIARQLRDALNESGYEALAEKYNTIRHRYPPEQVKENILNSLGYELLRARQTEDAIGVFKLNVEEYPESPNTYDSLGDAYRAAGQLKEAKENYERAVKLAGDLGDERLPTYRGKLDRVKLQLKER